MKRFRNILVAVDLSGTNPETGVELSTPSREALSRAIWLAGRTGGTLTIFSVLAVSPFEQFLEHELAQSPIEPGHKARNILDRFVAEAKKAGVDAQPKVAFGAPWQEI